MTLTPATVRFDLKCGKGAISEGEKCTKGAAQRVQPKRARSGSKRRNLKTAAKIAGAAALTAGIAYAPAAIIGGVAYTRRKGNRQNLVNRASVLKSKSNLLGRASALKGRVTQRSQRAQLERMYKSPSKRDSIYADGFSPELDSLAI